MVSLSKQRRVLALIPARGGSKGLSKKNIRMAGGRPLISWTISEALRSKYITNVVLSSEDDEIIAIAREWGCEIPFLRPRELSCDATSSMDVVLHALEQLPGYDYLILLQPTSPMRTAEHIDAAFLLMQEKGALSCVSVCESEESPYWMYEIRDNGVLTSLFPNKKNISRRQDLPPVFSLNGAIYIADIKWLKSSKNFMSEDCVPFIMSKRDSIDIDSKEDFEVFCCALKERSN